jgi:hypothetical protein
MTARSYSSFLIVALLLVFSFFLKIIPTSPVQAVGDPPIPERSLGDRGDPVRLPGATPRARENFARPVELRLDERSSRDDAPQGIPFKASAAVDLVIDDGAHFSSWGVTCGGGTAKQFIWLNRFSPDPSLFPFNLNEIWVLFDDASGENNVQTGDAVELLVYRDEDSDPTNGATWLSSFDLTVQATDGVTWSTYSLSSPVYLGGAGDVILAVVDRYTQDCLSAETYPATIDYTVNQGRSWMGWWEGTVPDSADLPPGEAFYQRSGNWMIRGYGETTAVQPTTVVKSATPTRTPTATPEPELGNAYLPFVLFVWPPTPEPTSTPQLAFLYVDNQTGGELCYEVLGTGIGEKCFPEGKHFYGSFAPGTYEWKASAGCGSDSGSKSFWEGESVHMFWCSANTLSGGDW